MADNYLEKRMDDYAHGRLGSKGARQGRRPGYASIKYPRQQVLIVGCDASASGEALLKAFVESTSVAVCFTANDRSKGTSLSQRCGGRFYPVSPEVIADDIAKRGETFDTVVLVNPHSIKEAIDSMAFMTPRQWLVVSDSDVELPEGLPCAVLTGHQPEAAALLALALVHPAVKVNGIIKP